MFKPQATIHGVLVPNNNLKEGDHVTLYGRGHPKGIITKVDNTKAKGGSVWYDVKLSSGKTITRRVWDFIDAQRP